MTTSKLNTLSHESDPTFLALESLFIRYTNLFKSSPNSLPKVQFEHLWPSPCVVKHEKTCESKDKGDQTDIYWRPSARKDLTLFSDLEAALEISFHPDIIIFYGSFWSNGFCVEREDINCSLIQIWNEEDQEQLKENLLGHAFAKIKSKLPLTFFIGCTFSEDIICLEQESGQIVLEKPGRKAHKILAPNLETFLLSISPTIDGY